jgi:hypothetical protein
MRIFFLLAATGAALILAMPAKAAEKCVDFDLAGTPGKVCGNGHDFTIESAGKKVADGEWQTVPESRGLWHVEGKVGPLNKLAFEVNSDGRYANKLVVQACAAENATLSVGATKVEYTKGGCDNTWRVLADFSYSDPS